jgi:O-antigen ligase
LGLGALFAYLYLQDKEVSFNLRVVMTGIVVILATQSALTFSRAGLYLAVGSAIAASLYQIRSRQMRIKFALAAVFMLVVGYYVVLPRLDVFSAGLFRVRFESTKSEGRDRFANAEMRAWQENPFFGLGPGGAESYRQQEMTKSRAAIASHTEYTRLLAEHGLLGLEALILLLVACWQNVRKAKAPDNKALSAALIVWSLLFMTVNGMRLVAPSFLLGLSFATLLSDQGKHLVERTRLNAQRVISRDPRFRLR